MTAHAPAPAFALLALIGETIAVFRDPGFK
jgi:hypothetical protein